MASINFNTKYPLRDDIKQTGLFEVKFFDNPNLQEWFDAINHEQLASLKQSWHEAIPAILTSVKRRGRGYLVLLRIANRIPGWIKNGKKVSLGNKQQTTRLIEGKILGIEQGSEEKFCLLQVEKREIEKIIAQGREQWLLPFSSVPYNLMRESVMKILLKIDAPVAKELLVEGDITTEVLNVIQGPPGTGKTTTIAELCFELFNRYGRNYNQGIPPHSKNIGLPKVLLTAFTHKACVNLVEKLDELNIPFITINIRGMSKHLREKYDLNYISERVLRTIHRTKKENSSTNWQRHKQAIQRQMLEQIIFIICTSMAAPRRFIRENSPPFQLAIVDEGSQMPLPILAGVVSLAEEIIVVGDPIQLPPVVISPLLEDKDNPKVNPLTYTVYDKVQRQDIEFLDKQYRGRPETFMLISGLFYDGQIHTGHYIPRLFDYPIIEFIDTSSYEPQEYKRVNYLEAEICQDLIDQLAAKDPSCSMKVGIITPFYSHAAYLRHVLRSPSPSIQLDVGTVHVAQGRTYDYVIFSLAATTPSPFLNPSKKWVLHLKQYLELIFQRLKREAASIEILRYPNYTAHLKEVYNHWSEYLEPFNEEDNKSANPSLRLRLFKDVERDFEFSLEIEEKLPENDFAPNIFNVALSRARHRLVILGHFSVLHQNPLVNLIYSWAEIFGQVRLLD